MVSPELIRRYPFFAGLSIEHINHLAQCGDEESVDTGFYFFHEDEETKKFYLNLEGAVAIVFELPEKDVEHKISEQFTRDFKTKDVVVSTVSPGDVFGWTGLVPPHKATAGAKAVTPCRVIVFDCEKLLQIFKDDCPFGYAMTVKAAQVMRERLRDIRIESLAYISE
jgi:CRP-like cAMP-binding protein